MEGLLDLFECVIESPRHGEYLQEFLISCTEHQAFYKKKSNAVQPFVSFTNSKLNTPSERLEGLLLLKTFLPQCSDEQFVDNAISWMNQCVKGVETSKCLETNNAAFSVLKTLLEMSSNFQELTKGIANSVNAKFAEQLKVLYKKPQVKLSALQCVQTMVRNYGAPCTSQKSVIESFVLQEADSKDASLVSAASRCFALLPLIGGAGSHGANHKARWLEQQRRTCGTLRQLLDEILDGVNEVEAFGRDEGSEVLPLDGITDVNTVVRIHEAANRFINVAKFLEAMLLNEFPVSKSVLPDTIINLVCRGLSINCCSLGNKGSTDMLTVGSVLPRIHVALLRVLSSLITCLGKNLYSHAKIICRLVLQTLQWTTSSSHDYATLRPYSALRAQACRTLIAWLRVAKAGSCVELTADELVQALLQDVVAQKAAVKLNMQGVNKSKKRKHNATGDETALIPSQPSVSSRVKLVNPTANDKTCLAALDALCWLVHAAGVFIKPTLHKLLQETALVVLFDVQRSARNDLPVPYSKVECRLSLYKLLQALTLDPHPMWPPPTQFALHILAQGQTDPSSQVSGFCTVALCSVEKLIHSSSQALQFPVSLEEMLTGVNVDVSSLANPIADQRPSDDLDAMSIISQRLSVDSGRSCPSPVFLLEDLRAKSTACDSAAPKTSKDNEIASTMQEDVLSNASTVPFPGDSRADDEVAHGDLIGSILEETPTTETVLNSASMPEGFSDLEDDLSEDELSENRTGADKKGLVDDSSAKDAANTSTQPLQGSDLADDENVGGVDLNENTTILISETRSEEILQSQAKSVTDSPTKGKLFQGKFSNVTTPKLLGGGEVSKVTRFDLKPKFVNLADDDDGSVVNLSSDDEFHESNISVVSSNSNYQESILNKSCITTDGDAFDEIEEENDEETVLLIQIPDNVNQNYTPLGSNDISKSSFVSNGTDNPTRNQECNVDEEEGILVIDFEMSNGATPVARKGDADVVEWEEPSPKRLKKDSLVVVADNFEGMSDAEVVKSLLDDFKRKLDE